LAWGQGDNHQKLNKAQKPELIERSKVGFNSQQPVADYLKQTFKAHYTMVLVPANLPPSVKQMG
jgi:hypothetical protein